MAKNRKFEKGTQLAYALAGKESGDPVVIGQIPGVALIKTDADGQVTVQHDGVFILPVKGIDGSGNSAVVAGDILYFVNADTPKLSKKNTGVRFGYALEAVASGATADIQVKIGY
jgi:predicted RecA/RadA family phage recombinase